MADGELWVRRFHPAREGSLRLVCFPHAGGSATFFQPLSRRLSPGVEVLCVQYPGRQDRRAEPLFGDVRELAASIAEALVPWAGRPWAFFGHSMGAIVAFETARLLQGRPGVAPLVRLIASGRRAPGTYRHETVHQRDDAGLIAELRRLNGTENDVLGDEELLRLVLPAIRGDYRAIETYRGEPGARIGAPVSVFVGDADPRVTLEEARAWEGHTDGGFELHVFPGGHFYLVPGLAETAERIVSVLGRDREEAFSRAAGRTGA
ncbi:thioesterase II family protein [Streptomyces hoynatensis]|uniref:Thioesterase n=1 Tax=Streptomyces hoynatensis TaxID=1141874 RepID=A0A3A9YSD4_9ACTN|nr:alpha/beta fold hydrolase [Streptomyces hoynatensis]RKN38958.1 thioesterase [Streptomyces hoynatensis]